MKQILRVPAVKRGARVRVLSPGSYPHPQPLAQGMDALRSLGYEVSLGRHALDKENGFFAGSVQARLDDLHQAFLDPSIRAIVSSRGGYGSNYLLDRLDLDLVRANPKPLLGYSDLTAMQTWLLDQAGLPSFHGPMAAADFSLRGGVDLESLSAALSGRCWKVGSSQGLRTLRPGRASGVLYGGCLSILAAGMGTPYAAQTEGKLLFLEDLNVKLYQLDRLLRQMVMGGKFAGVVGVVFGEMTGCLAEGQAPAALESMILRVLDSIEGPIAIGLRSGHVTSGNVTLVFGATAELDLSGEPALAFLEPATSPQGQ